MIFYFSKLLSFTFVSFSREKKENVNILWFWSLIWGLRINVTMGEVTKKMCFWHAVWLFYLLYLKRKKTNLNVSSLRLSLLHEYFVDKFNKSLWIFFWFYCWYFLVTVFNCFSNVCWAFFQSIVCQNVDKSHEVNFFLGTLNKLE